MQMPSVVHPKKFTISGMFFEVVSYSPLTDDHARKIAIMFYCSRKFLKKDKGKTFRVLTQFDESSSGLI
ncbi:MAG: hypothetical protein KAI50_15195 [Desulfobacterales bacterium]|nr:hypothetical protein [Desulfobacterales bacterium]